MDKIEPIDRDVCYFLSKEKSKISKKALSWIGYDWISIVKCDNIFWYEGHTENIPKYIREYLNKFIKKNLGVEYLYDKTIKMEGKNEYIY